MALVSVHSDPPMSLASKISGPPSQAAPNHLPTEQARSEPGKEKERGREGTHFENAGDPSLTQEICLAIENGAAWPPSPPGKSTHVKERRRGILLTEGRGGGLAFGGFWVGSSSEWPLD